MHHAHEQVTDRNLHPEMTATTITTTTTMTTETEKIHAALVPLPTDDDWMATHIRGMHHASCTSTSYRQKLTD